MSNKPVLAAFFLATAGVAAGAAWAATENPSVSSQQAATMRDYTKLSAAGTKAFRDLRLARRAISDGDKTKAKTYVDEAAQLFATAKTDDTAFIKALSELMTAAQVSARKPGSKPDESQAATTTSSEKIAWLPVNGEMNVDEDYTLNLDKVKAVDEANKSLANGDRQGAMDQLRLAGIKTSIVIEVVPRDQTVSDVNQAAALIDAGKYDEGGQMLQKVQGTARYDVTELVATTKAPPSQSPPTAQSPKPAPDAGEAEKPAEAPKAN